MTRRFNNFTRLAVLSLIATGAFATETQGDVSSADHDLRPKGARLTLGEALRFADIAVGNLYGDQSFQAVAFQYDCDSIKICNWSFVYLGKPSIWHGKRVMLSMTVPVVVNDRTKHAEVIVPHFVDAP